MACETLGAFGLYQSDIDADGWARLVRRRTTGEGRGSNCAASGSPSNPVSQVPQGDGDSRVAESLMTDKQVPSAIVSFETKLRTFLQGRVCIVGVGNRQWGDDGAGSRLIDVRRPDSPGYWFDAGVAPENFLEPIAKADPDAVLFVDAAVFGGLPGEFCLMDASRLDTTSVSTHAGSLRMLGEYLARRTGARVEVLAIQPRTVAMQKGLSAEVLHSVHALSGMLHVALLANASSTP